MQDERKHESLHSMKALPGHLFNHLFSGGMEVYFQVGGIERNSVRVGCSWQSLVKNAT